MSRPTVPFPSTVLGRAKDLLRTTKDVRVLRSVQAIILREEEHMKAKRVSSIVGFSLSHIHTWWSHVGRQGLKAFEDMSERRGGRHHAYMTKTEEDQFITPFLARAQKGGVLFVRPIHEAYEKRVGKKVKPMTVYRLLHRHGWRKIAPRPRHPKTDKEAQKNFTEVLFPPSGSSSSSFSGS